MDEAIKNQVQENHKNVIKLDSSSDDQQPKALLQSRIRKSILTQMMKMQEASGDDSGDVSESTDNRRAVPIIKNAILQTKSSPRLSVRGLPHLSSSIFGTGYEEN